MASLLVRIFILLFSPFRKVSKPQEAWCEELEVKHVSLACLTLSPGFFGHTMLCDYCLWGNLGEKHRSLPDADGWVHLVSLPVQYRVNMALAPFNDKLCFKDYISILLVFCLYNNVLIFCLPSQSGVLVFILASLSFKELCTYNRVVCGPPFLYKSWIRMTICLLDTLTM